MDTTTTIGSPSSRTLRSATSPSQQSKRIKSPDGLSVKRIKSPDGISEITDKSSKTKESKKKRSTPKSQKKRKHEERDDDDKSNDEDEEQSSNKKGKVENATIQFNREERKYVKMKVRSGETITSPCWTSKLCQIASLTKDALELIRSKKCK